MSDSDRAHRGSTEEFRCRICRKAVKPEDKEFPFCSERCRLIDLGAWADERYRISREAREDERDPDAFGDLPPAPPGGDDEGR